MLAFFQVQMTVLERRRNVWIRTKSSGGWQAIGGRDCQAGCGVTNSGANGECLAGHRVKIIIPYPRRRR
jgi:hypothetical protein